jgi:hypothetical protein
MKTNMNDTGIYYTSAYEKRIIIALGTVILATFVLTRLFVFHQLQAIGLSVIHGYIQGMIVSYFVYGVTCPKRYKWIYNGIGTLLFVVMAVLDRRFQIHFMILISLLEVLFLLIGDHLIHWEFSGDNASFRDTDYDITWFDYVNPDLERYPILFPRDIAKYRRDRLSGVIVAVGMGLRYKYQGLPVAEIRADSGLYLCPLQDVIPNPRLKCRGSAVIASREGDAPCEVTLHWHEYGGYTVVREGNT